MFSDMSDEEFIEMYSNKVLEDSQVIVGSSRNHKHTERWSEREEEVAELGMDIGDYSFIDSLLHCPMVDWVAQGKVLQTVKDQ